MPKLNGETTLHKSEYHKITRKLIHGGKKSYLSNKPHNSNNKQAQQYFLKPTNFATP